MQTATDLDQVLSAISGPDLYRANIFNITGVPAGASAGQIRRMREEAVLQSRLNPDLDADAIRSAFETMRDPVARLIHELLWFPAPQQHREAVETEYQGPFPATSGEAKRLDKLWVNSLTAWALRLEAPEFWAHAKERVKQIDDPRLTTGTVRRLRDRLPQHIVSVTADLAVRAARCGDSGRLVKLLVNSPFPSELVRDTLRDAVRPAEQSIVSACSGARDALQANQSRAEDIAEDLLGKVGSPLLVVEALRGTGDDITVVLSDEVALVVNNCAVAHNLTGHRPDIALRLLASAKSFARLRTTTRLVDDNIAVVSLNDLTTEMRELCERDKVDKADRRRRALLSVLPDGELKQALQSIPPDDNRVGADVPRVPGTFSLFGCGKRFVALTRGDDPYHYTALLMVSILFVPLIPVSAYFATIFQLRARIPLGRWARWWRFAVLNFLLGLVVSAVFGSLISNMDVLLTVYGVSLLVVGVRWLRLRMWALRKVGR
ncbi:hypothetical protein JOF56_004795 [Kibdelosporangium banguiense]|uniref:Uncharacterized protein n=1 Tax=Kibdelosporangium banguiense TaxID=1365924 RepID=A0ABS4TK69_9PSEU|nr:hypothetical protein [Kibdelosporangium banguiense]MBP2324410.1 hypothetical protein [Kibdelosporangium banguiense]